LLLEQVDLLAATGVRDVIQFGLNGQNCTALVAAGFRNAGFEAVVGRLIVGIAGHNYLVEVGTEDVHSSTGCAPRTG